MKKILFLALLSIQMAYGQKTALELIEMHGLHPKSKIDANLLKYVEVCLPYFKTLKGVKLVIRERQQIIPLTTVPAISNLWHKKSNWKIKVNVSTGTIKLLEPILVRNMPDSASTGVIGHELSHVTDFYNRKASYMINVFLWHIAPKKLDKFEFETDHIAIKAGFGKYLLAWSKTTNAVFKSEPKEKERYMSPITIEKYMKMYPDLYP